MSGSKSFGAGPDVRQVWPDVRQMRLRGGVAIYRGAVGVRPHLRQVRRDAPGIGLKVWQVRVDLRQIWLRRGSEDGGDQGIRLFELVKCGRGCWAGGGCAGRPGRGLTFATRDLGSRKSGVLELEGHMADAEEQGAEKASGFAIGNALNTVFEEGLEDLEDLHGNVGGVKPGEIAVDADPVAMAGETVVLGERALAGCDGGRVMVAAEGLTAFGGAAAFVAVGQADGTFGCCGHEASPAKKKAAKGRLFSLFSLFLEYQFWSF